MKTESTALAKQRKTKCREEKRQTLNFLVSVVVLTRAFLPGPSSQVRIWAWDSFSELASNGGSNFRLASHRPVWCPTDCSRVQPTFKPELPPYFHLCYWGEEYNGFRCFHTCAKNMEPWSFFRVIFNHHRHSPVTGWPTTSALAWLTQGSTARS